MVFVVPVYSILGACIHAHYFSGHQGRTYLFEKAIAKMLIGRVDFTRVAKINFKTSLHFSRVLVENNYSQNNKQSDFKMKGMGKSRPHDTTTTKIRK